MGRGSGKRATRQRVDDLSAAAHADQAKLQRATTRRLAKLEEDLAAAHKAEDRHQSRLATASAEADRIRGEIAQLLRDASEPAVGGAKKVGHAAAGLIEDAADAVVDAAGGVVHAAGSMVGAARRSVTSKRAGTAGEAAGAAANPPTEARVKAARPAKPSTAKAPRPAAAAARPAKPATAAAPKPAKPAKPAAGRPARVRRVTPPAKGPDHA